MKSFLIFLVMVISWNATAAGEPSMYFAVAASQTDSALCATGKCIVGNYLKRLVCTVGTAATSTVSIKDGSGSSAIPLLAANSAIGAYVIDLDIRSTIATNAGFYLTTGAGVSCVAVGRFFNQP